MLLVLELNPDLPDSRPMLYRLSYFDSRIVWIGFIWLTMMVKGRKQSIEEENSMTK
jgi:hypothetical protein